MILDFLNSNLFVHLIVLTLTVVTTILAYAARQIIKNQNDLMELKHILSDVKKEVSLIKKNMCKTEERIEASDKEQNGMHQNISKEISRISTIIDLYVKPWDGVNRRKN